jgi:hypothetical protein
MFAPYVDIMQWPTFDVSKVAVKTGVLYYTLAFICSGIGGKPAWGGSVPMEQNFYRDQLLRLRQKGGDAVASFGGAFGMSKLFFGRSIIFKFRNRSRIGSCN